MRLALLGERGEVVVRALALQFLQDLIVLVSYFEQLRFPNSAVEALGLSVHCINSKSGKWLKYLLAMDSCASRF